MELNKKQKAALASSPPSGMSVKSLLLASPAIALGLAGAVAAAKIGHDKYKAYDFLRAVEEYEKLRNLEN